MNKKKIHKTNAMRILDKNKIHFQIHEYPWNEEHLDAKTAAEQVGMPFEKIYKTLVAKGNKTGEIVACIPASDELNLKELAKVSGNKKVEMLPMKDLEKTTGYIRGGCSPIGMKKQFPTYISSASESMETIVVSAGKRGMQIEINPNELLKITNAVYVDITV
jgi:Cys-tRNA(Pro)/Cys-tRNA(Cys) deacylase